MSDIPTSSSQNPSSPPATVVDSPTALFLRAECETVHDTSQKSTLLHELAVAEERGGDEAGAARDYLAAFNMQPSFREPLEGLVRLLERRKSVRNLPKLLDALLRSAETSEEKARALLKRAAFLADYKQDVAEARTALEQATDEQPDDSTAWLELELIAGKTSDQDLRIQALENRVKLGADPTWQVLLSLEIAQLLASRGDMDGAIALLESVCPVETGARYTAIATLAEFAQRDGRDEVCARALESQAELALLALADPEKGDALGVPLAARNAETAADAWLRAADRRRRQGDLPGATALLDKALERVGPKAPVLSARLAVAEASGDAATAAKMARSLLEQSITGSAAASLHMRVAEDAATRDDLPAALEALASALEADPGCIPARALQLDLLGSGKDPALLAGALEAMAAELPSDEGKGRAYLLSAYVYALEAHDLQGAKAALSQAGLSGVAPATLARITRLLAVLAEDVGWYEEATRKLLATVDEPQRISLWFELGRNRILRGDEEGASKAFESIAASSAGGWLGRALGAYALRRPRTEGQTDGEASADAGPRALSADTLDQLGEADPDPAAKRALTVAAARRADLAGDTNGAMTRLRALVASDAADPVAAAYLADLERRSGRPLDAAKVLADAAAAIPDQRVATSFHLEAAVLYWRHGNQQASLDELDLARDDNEAATKDLLGWALRTANATSVEDRRRLIDRAMTVSDEGGLLALERFALEAFAPDRDDGTVASALASAEETTAADLKVAASLGRAIWDERTEDRTELLKALDNLGHASEKALPLVRFEQLRLAKIDKDHARAASCAHDLVTCLDSLPAVLEWFGNAFAADDHTAEIEARRKIADSLEGEARSALLASASLVALVDAPDANHPLLDPTDPPSQLMNLELAPAGCDPRRRATALAAVGDSLGTDAQSRDSLLLAGYNYLVVGDAMEAAACFNAVVTERPDDVFAWEGVRAAADALGDQDQVAAACAQLGELCADNARAAQFWETAGSIWLEQEDGSSRGEAALERAFSRDPSQASAFDRLFRRVRDRGESDKLLGLIARRLEVIDDPPEMAKLFWERARTLRQKGDREGALSALENVTMFEPNHVGALVLRSEIDISERNFGPAAENLAKLAALAEAPAQQRLVSGVGAADLYENKLGDSAKALEVLVKLHRSGLSTLPVRERLARAAAKTGAWQHATAMLEELMVQRTSAEGRAEAASLCMAIWRDKVNEPLKAEKAVAKLIEEVPDDSDALDLLLSHEFPRAVRNELLARGRDAVVAKLVAAPMDAEKIARLSRIAQTLGDLPLRQATLGALRAAVGDQKEIEEELASLDSRVARLPQVAVDDNTIAAISDPTDSGPLAQLFHAIAAPLAEALGPSLETLGGGKKNKIDPRAGLPLRNEIAAWAGALGMGEFDLYVGGVPNSVHGIPGDPPALVVGPGITAPLSASTRQAIARELFAMRRGISVTLTRDDTTVAAIVVAACNLADVRIESVQYAMLAEVQRQLGKALPRRIRKVLPDVCHRIAHDRLDARLWARAAVASTYRMAAIAAGDVSLVLTDALGVPVSRLPSMVAHDDRASRLIAFVLSPEYLELRNRLGMGVT